MSNKVAVCQVTDIRTDIQESLKWIEKFTRSAEEKNVPMRAERAREKKIWLLSADVTGKREGRIAYGSTSVINPDGIIIEQVPFMETGVIVVEV